MALAMKVLTVCRDTRDFSAIHVCDAHSSYPCMSFAESARARWMEKSDPLNGECSYTQPMARALIAESPCIC